MACLVQPLCLYMGTGYRTTTERWSFPFDHSSFSTKAPKWNRCNVRHWCFCPRPSPPPPTYRECWKLWGLHVRENPLRFMTVITLGFAHGYHVTCLARHRQKYLFLPLRTLLASLQIIPCLGRACWSWRCEIGTATTYVTTCGTHQ